MSEDASQNSAAANNGTRAMTALPKTVGENDKSLVQPDSTPTPSCNSQAYQPEEARNAEDTRVESPRKDMAWTSSARPQPAPPQSPSPETPYPETPYPGTTSAASSKKPGARLDDPSRKVETPDMLRWRAEMLLDEMMVGAVDASAGDGAPSGWRAASIHADAPLQLDDRPRKVQNTAPASSFGSTASATQFDTSPHNQNTDSRASNSHESNSHESSHFAATANVRAALPTPSAPRMPTALASNGSASAASDGGATGYATAMDAADDGRPTGASPAFNGSRTHDADTKSAASKNTPFNGVAARSAPYTPLTATRDSVKAPQRLDGKTGRQANGAQYNSQQHDPQYELQPDARNGVNTSPGARQSSPPSSPPSSPRQPSASSRLAAKTPPARSAPVPSIDPLDGPDAWEQMAPRSTGTPANPANPVNSRSPTRTNGTANNTGNRVQAGMKLTAVEQRYPRAIQPNDSDKRSYTPGGVHNNDSANSQEPWQLGLGPVRLNPAVVNGSSVTGAMAVNRASSRYASLLPRATPWDLHEMAREIVSLQDEMARVLPSGHESSRRARHLLEKAHTIFASDPMRSAEVDYYLTQVRSIVQRSRQTLHWSDLYRQQLNRYHLAWVGFSILMLVLGLLYAGRVTTWATLLFGWSENGLSAAFVAPVLISMFAGSLGGSVGALFTIRRYHHKDMGFFDRKYSLRGLILPVIGLIGGISLFAIFVALYWAVGTTVPLPALLALLPACAAFLFGLLQENIYGTRD